MKPSMSRTKKITSRKRVGEVFCDVMSYRMYHPLLGLIINSSSRKLHFTSKTSSSNKGSIRSYRMCRGIVYMYFHKAAGHLFGKALFLSHVVGIGQVRRHQKVSHITHFSYRPIRNVSLLEECRGLRSACDNILLYGFSH